MLADGDVPVGRKRRLLLQRPRSLVVLGHLPADAFVLFHDTRLRDGLQVDVVHLLRRHLGRRNGAFGRRYDHRFLLIFIRHQPLDGCVQLDVFVDHQRHLLLRRLGLDQETHLRPGGFHRTAGLHNNFTDGMRIGHFRIDTGQRSSRTQRHPAGSHFFVLRNAPRFILGDGTLQQRRARLAYHLGVVDGRSIGAIRRRMQQFTGLQLGLLQPGDLIGAPLLAFQNGRQGSFLALEQLGAADIRLDRRHRRG